VIESLFGQTRNLNMPNLCRFKLNNLALDITHVENLKDGLMKDALSRDFTINALYANAEGIIFDPLGRGMNSLNNMNCQLEFIAPLSEACKDPNRILRYLNFSGCGFSGDLDSGFIIEKLKCLQSLYAPFKDKIKMTETEIEKKIQLYGKFDSMLCKFFMSGRAVMTFDILMKHDYFKIFFSATFTQTSYHWIRWRLEKMDNAVLETGEERAFLTRNQIYGILMTAMLTNTATLKEDFVKLKESPPFPTSLRWNLAFGSILVWTRERDIFTHVPAQQLPLLLNVTAGQLKQVKQEFLHTQPIDNPMPAPALPFSQGYQHYGYFNPTPPMAMTNAIPVGVPAFRMA
jgi:hypothetical protein